MLVASYYLKEPPINNQIFTKEMMTPLNLEQSRDFNDKISIPNFSISIFNKATV